MASELGKEYCQQAQEAFTMFLEVTKKQGILKLHMDMYLITCLILQ